MDVLLKIVILILSVILAVEAIEAFGLSAEQVSIVSGDPFSFTTAFLFIVFFAAAEIALLQIAKKIKLFKLAAKASSSSGR